MNFLTHIIRGLKQKILFPLAACGLTGVIFFLSHFPQAQIPSDLWTGLGDDIAHALAYGFLALLIFLALPFRAESGAQTQGKDQHPSGVLHARFFRVFWILCSLSAFDELSQIAVGRACEFSDWLSGIAGVVFVLAMLKVIIYRGQGIEK